MSNSRLENTKITDLIFDISRKYPDQTALIFLSESISYKELEDRVVDVSEGLKNAGVKTGMGIGLIAHNSPDFIIYGLAVMHVGGVFIPVSHQLKSAEVYEICVRTGMHFLFQENSLAQLNLDFEKVNINNWVCYSMNKKESLPLIPEIRNAAFIRFTSGTTGKAKGVVLSHQSIIERTESANEILKLDHNDTVIWVLSMAYHFVVSILLYLRYGCRVVICDNFMGDSIMDAVNRHSGTFLYVSPMHVRMLNRIDGDHKMPTLRTVISTSMAITPDLCNAFINRFGIPITQAFGIIEIGLPIVNTREQDSVPEAIGYSLPAYDVAILDDGGSPVVDGDVGQLAITGPGMFDAYLDPFIKREDAMEYGYFITGDLAISDNKRITIVGRKKNVINVSGNKAFPEEIEAVINKFPGVIKSRVKSFKHPLLIEGVMAEVVTEKHGDVDIEALIAHCRKQLTTYKIPQRIVFVEDIEMTDSGKILRG